MTTIRFLNTVEDTYVVSEQTTIYKVPALIIKQHQQKLSYLLTELEALGGKVSVDLKNNEVILKNCTEALKSKIVKAVSHKSETQYYPIQNIALNVSL